MRLKDYIRENDEDVKIYKTGRLIFEGKSKDFDNYDYLNYYIYNKVKYFDFTVITLDENIENHYFDFN